MESEEAFVPSLNGMVSEPSLKLAKADLICRIKALKEKFPRIFSNINNVDKITNFDVVEPDGSRVLASIVPSSDDSSAESEEASVPSLNGMVSEPSLKQAKADLICRIKALKEKFPRIFSNINNVDKITNFDVVELVGSRVLAPIVPSSDDSSADEKEPPQADAGSDQTSRRRRRHKKKEVPPPQLTIDKLNSIIYELLQMQHNERENYLIKIAKERRILIKNEDGSLEYHPMLGKGAKLPPSLTNGTGTEDSHSVDKPWRRSKARWQNKEETFEGYVNSIVHEGLTKEEQNEFTFSNIYPDDETPDNHIFTEEYTRHLEEFAKKCVDKGLGVIRENVIRINARNNQQGFLKFDEEMNDAMIDSVIGRKCALHGDLVRVFVKINPKVEQAKVEPRVDGDSVVPPKHTCKAFVIDIVEKRHSRICACYYVGEGESSKTYLEFKPRDPKVPFVHVDKEAWSAAVKEMDGKTSPETVYLLKIVGTHNKRLVGEVEQIIGKLNTLEFESKAILLEHGLDVRPYDDKFNKMYEGAFEIPEEKLSKRFDLRNECIFTIDPETAKDLDDAVSCKQLSDGTFEVGVHIADVSYFLEENCELDNLVKKRATTVFLVNDVFHMLPKPLCLWCSLLPGEDKLSFSVIWKLNDSAEIVETKFVKSIMNSCGKLSYEHAQQVIDGDLTGEKFPELFNGYSIEVICDKIKTLHGLATKLKAKRIENGALRIDKPKLCFTLDEVSKEPIDYSLYESKEANSMIEEFMLLANQSVAKHIHEKYPNIAILRNHPPPDKYSMDNFKSTLDAIGLELNTSTSKTIADSMKKITTKPGSTKAVISCLNSLLSKPMARAMYFCSNGIEEQAFCHYALSFPIYTHFTSPIRRYADILVHRLLNAAVEYSETPKRTPAELDILACICNRKKYDAKLAGDASGDLHFMYYVKKRNTLIMQAAVLEVYDFSFDVILIETGHTISIKFSECGIDAEIEVFTKKKPHKATIRANGQKTLEIRLFAELPVEVWVERNELFAKISYSSLI